MRLDVFTQVPHAFAWLTEQRPLAAVLGRELELRLFNYRDTTPLRAGQVDDEPYGGGAGMVLRVDVVAAALDAVYGGEPRAARRRADAAGPAARPGRRRGARGGAELTLLSSRFEGFDERVVSTSPPTRSRSARTSSPAASCRRWCCSTRSSRRLPGRADARLGRAGELLGRARRRPRVPALHPPARVPRLARAGRAALRRPRPGRDGGASRAGSGAPPL